MIDQYLNKIHQSHVLDLLPRVPDESMQCIVTSPPYWGLRDYGLPPQVWGGDPGCEHEWQIGRKKDTRGLAGSTIGGTFQKEARRFDTEYGFCKHCGAWLGSLGLEPTPELYIEHLTEISREFRRVLRKDGTLWLNMGDCYAGNGLRGGGDPTIKVRNLGSSSYPEKRMPASLKPKDLVGMPWRVAFALQADGWWLRSNIIYNKTNAMPESAKDRPTCAHEFIFLLTRSAKYFYDNEAIKEPAGLNSHARGNGVNPKAQKTPMGWNTGPGDHHGKIGQYPKHKQNASFSGAINQLVAKRNKRSVWTLPTEPCSYSHYATFPKKLITPCILAGTSEKGACAECGAPWERIIKREPIIPEGSGNMGKRESALRAAGKDHDNSFPSTRTIGWQPTCECGAGTAPCVVLDPFMGTGTTAVVSARLGRDFVGIELNPKDIEYAEKRLEPYRKQLKLDLLERLPGDKNGPPG